MNTSIIENGSEIRRAFIGKFTMSRDEFESTHADWIKTLAEKNYTVRYEERYLWELMEYPAVAFDDALQLLRSLHGEVFFMSENENKPCCRGIRLDGVEHKGGVAKMNAAELADLIEYEWYEEWRLSAQNMYLAGTILPDDLYVFDASMTHLFVFTHENDFWELEVEQPMKAAASRYCLIHGFDTP